MKLKESQESFILNHFFKNDDYVGWKNIAKQLLREGKCVVAGKECIWKGGIGNFIYTTNADNLIDCVQYEFNSEDFFRSEWYKETHNQYCEELLKVRAKLEKEISDINEIILLSFNQKK